MIANTVSRLLTRRAPTVPTTLSTPIEEATPPAPWRGLPHVLTMEGAFGERQLVITAHDSQLARHTVTVAFQPDEPLWCVGVFVEPPPLAREAPRLLGILESAELTCWRHHDAERSIHPVRAALFGQAARRLKVYIADTREAARTDDEPAEDRAAAEALAKDREAAAALAKDVLTER